MRKILLASACMALMPFSVYAQDIAPSYGVPGYPSAQRIVPSIGGLCVSSDGSNTVIACSSGGGSSVSVTSSVLPTGAATSANQPTNAAQGSTTSGQTGILSQGAVLTANPTYTTGQTAPLSLTTAGGIRVTLQSASGSALSGTFATSSGSPAAGIGVLGGYNSTPLTLSNGTAAGIQVDVNGNTKSVIAPTSDVNVGLVPVVTSAASGTLVCKGSAGNLYSAYATSTVAGWLLVFNATTPPADGTVTPTHAIPVPANGEAGINYTISPENYTTGISMAFSTTGPFIKTISATAFMHCNVK